MAGHSHWAKIKRAKGANDARRGREWSKLARRIIVAAKLGGGNPDENLSLRYAIDDAKAANMPKDTIANAVKKGAGGLDAENFEAIVYEGYGPGGVAFMVDCLTNNRARTAPEMRKIFERGNGQLGASGCVGWMFEQKGVFTVSGEAATEDNLMEVALDAEAEDVRNDGDSFEVTCAPQNFHKVKQALAAANIATLSAAISMIPKNTVAIEGDAAAAIVRLMETLEDHEDVQNVYANFDISEETMRNVTE
ncbi:MAG: YebC/PmpR family DNA-binding transcriptional regulator [Phycisphaerae bacterium]|nr:YebC/PmpR family DNA-binding transcriptional regulator [Phycisphaerae bacterium]